ncbi:hypothetical protein [Miniphocaeibacter massiliensis]|uniref:hypothetical protein n=1 Tax=Miniphocaeibacter massiliensis TaxID=2041841 RepID=UPI000C1C6499|nr:hypothetical protein [Miniphocaeibacter massiliensis]
MKEKIKKNRIYIILFFITLIIFLFTALKEAGILNTIRLYYFDREVFEKLLMDYNIKIPGNIFETLRLDIFTDFSFPEWIIVFGNRLFQFVLPVYASIMGVYFYRKSIKNVEKLNYKETKKSIISNSLKFSIAMFSAYLLLCLFSLLIGNGQRMPGYTRPLFSDILGGNFYSNYTVLYFIMEGMLKYIFMPFVYATFAQSLYLVSKKKVVNFLIPILYYVILFFIGLELIKREVVAGIYINPMTILAAGDYSYLSTVLLMLVSAIPLFAAKIIVDNKVKNQENILETED